MGTSKNAKNHQKYRRSVYSGRYINNDDVILTSEVIEYISKIDEQILIKAVRNLGYLVTNFKVK